MTARVLRYSGHTTDVLTPSGSAIALEVGVPIGQDADGNPYAVTAIVRRPDGGTDIHVRPSTLTDLERWLNGQLAVTE